MVLEAPNPNLLEATCCSVEVVNGPDGFLLTIFDEISLILNFLFFNPEIAFSISSFFLKVNFSIFSPSN